MRIPGLTLPVLVLVSALLAAESDTRTVQTQFNRCESEMDRNKRDLARFEESVGRLKRLSERSPSANSASSKISSLESRIDYFRNRIDRSSGQADKIREDLKGLSGPTCPDCIASSVNMYCRVNENLSSELDRYRAQAEAIESELTAGGVPPSSETLSSTDSLFSVQRRRIEARVSPSVETLDSCSSDAGKSLWNQCRINLRKADSLKTAGSVEQGLRSLNLAESLLLKALDRCGAK